MFFGIGVLSVFKRLQQNRAAQRHRVQQVDITRIKLEHPGNLFFCVQRPAHPMSPHSAVRRLAGVRYQLDSELA